MRTFSQICVFFCRFGEMSAYFVGIVRRETGLPVATFQKMFECCVDARWGRV